MVFRIFGLLFAISVGGFEFKWQFSRLYIFLVFRDIQNVIKILKMMTIILANQKVSEVVQHCEPSKPHKLIIESQFDCLAFFLNCFFNQHLFVSYQLDLCLGYAQFFKTFLLNRLNNCALAFIDDMQFETIFTF